MINIKNAMSKGTRKYKKKYINITNNTYKFKDAK